MQRGVVVDGKVRNVEGCWAVCLRFEVVLERAVSMVVCSLWPQSTARLQMYSRYRVRFKQF